MTTKQVCEMIDCGWHGTSDDVLKAPNPFEPGKVLWACPACKNVNSIYLGCDEPGCWEISTCGTPADSGFRRTCGKHVPKNIGQK